MRLFCTVLWSLVVVWLYSGGTSKTELCSFASQLSVNCPPGVLNFAMLFRFLVLLLCFGVGPAVFLFRRGDVPGTLVQLLEEEGVWSKLLKNVCTCWFDFNKLGNHY